MKFSRSLAIGAAAALGIAASAVIAHPGQMGGGMGMHGQTADAQHGRMGGKGHARMGGQSLMTPGERGAFREQMRNAETAEERQRIAEARRAEMHKRAIERNTAPQAPAEGESAK